MERTDLSEFEKSVENFFYGGSKGELDDILQISPQERKEMIEKRAPERLVLEVGSIFVNIPRDDGDELFLKVLSCVIQAQNIQLDQVVDSKYLSYLSSNLCFYVSKDVSNNTWRVQNKVRAFFLRRLLEKVPANCFVAMNQFIARELEQKAAKCDPQLAYYLRGVLLLDVAWHFWFGEEYIKSLAVLSSLLKSTSGDYRKAVIRAIDGRSALVEAIMPSEVPIDIRGWRGKRA